MHVNVFVLKLRELMLGIMLETVKEAPTSTPGEVQAMAEGLSALVQTGTELSSSAQVSSHFKGQINCMCIFKYCLWQQKRYYCHNAPQNAHSPLKTFYLIPTSRSRLHCYLWI